MTEECNIAVVRRFIEGAINGRDLAVVDDTWADDMIWHGGSMGTYEGKAAFLEFAAANAACACADMHLEIHVLLAHDNKVVARFTNSCTNVGPTEAIFENGYLSETPQLGARSGRQPARETHAHEADSPSSRRATG